MSLGRDALIARWAVASHQSPRVLQTSGPITPPPANLRALAGRELATPGRYHLAVKVPRPETSLWMRLWSWLRDRWVELWQATYGRAHLGRDTAVVIGDVLIAIVALVILVVAVRLLAGIVLERRARVTSVQALETPAGASAMYAAACERARRGDYAQASRLLFAATISALSSRGVVRDDRSATVGDFRRALRRDESSLVPSFDLVSSVFVTSAYAERPVEAPQWERARAAYLSLAGQAEA